jgi:Peptidase family S41
MHLMMKTLLIAAVLIRGMPVQAQSDALAATEQSTIIRAAADLIEARYVDADRGKAIARKLRQSVSRWRTPQEREAFAKDATTFMREISSDGHLGLSYSAQSLPEEDGEADFNATEMNRWYGPQLNHGVEKIERLADNIMLLDLRVFPPTEMAGDVFAAAMTVVAQGEALIIDLRNNGGGAETVNLLTGYLLEPGSPLSGSYTRPTDVRSYATSPAWVPGRRFGSVKPLYILISRKTFSAAEALAYDLQALKRATIIGEVSGGGAHPFEYRRIHPHFAVNLPESKSINPITNGNWQDVGVKPDIAVPAEQALDKALELARSKIAVNTASKQSD